MSRVHSDDYVGLDGRYAPVDWRAAFILADRTAARRMIGYWHDAVVFRLSVTKCTVAKWHIQQQRVWKIE